MKRKVDGQLDLLSVESNQAAPPAATSPPSVPAPVDVLVRKRDGSSEPFAETRIALALESAFKAVRDIPADEPMTGALTETVNGLAQKIAARLLGEAFSGATLDVEFIQDAVENQLMCDGFLTEARRYILYREDRRKVREQKAHAIPEPPRDVYVVRSDGRRELFDLGRVRSRLIQAMQGLQGCDVESLLAELARIIGDGTPTDQIVQILIALTKSRRVDNPIYDKLGARLALKEIYREVIRDICPVAEFPALHRERFSYAIQDAVHNNQLAPELLMYDLDQLSHALKLERDDFIGCDGLQWLHETCFARHGVNCVETPQYFWMRLAMALAANETEKEQRAIQFYEILSSLRFVPSEKLLRTIGRSAAINAQAASADVEEVELTSRVAGHVNLVAHVHNGALDELLLYGTVAGAVRLLDDAVELHKYRLDAVAQHAREHRDIAIGITGSAVTTATDLAEATAEAIAYYATLASATLAAERGSYPTYTESNWNMGVLPFDGLKLSQPNHDSTRAPTKDWTSVRAALRRHGIRNGHLLALMPGNSADKIIGMLAQPSSFSDELNRILCCRRWVDGAVWITLPPYLIGPDLEQACLLAQQLGIRPYVAPTRMTMGDEHPFLDAAAATKVLKTIEKSQ
jgi:hypothetical protein